MITLSLESATETIDLNSIMDTDEGVQAIAGLTGFGLPPVEVQWAEGAGDGAKYRGRRILPRDIDLPIYIVASDSEALRDEVNLLARVLSDEATLRITRWNDTLWVNEEWTTKVARTGGGDVTYGEDTTGDVDMKMTITLRAGDPYWTKVTPRASAWKPVPTSITLPNSGSTDCYPTWRVDGPTLGFSLTSPQGEQFRYTDYINEGGYIIVNTRAGTVINQRGESRYDAVGASPRFFPLHVGNNTIAVAIDNTSADYTAQNLGVVRINFVLNPNVSATSSSWVLGTGASYDAPNHLLKLIHNGTAPLVSTTVTGLTIGQTYQVRADTGVYATFRAPGSARWTMQDGTSGAVLTTGLTSYAAPSTTAPILGTFVAKSTSAKFTYSPAAGTSLHPNWYWIRNAYIGLPGTYFDGNTADTTTNHFAWAGTANASRSNLSVAIPADTTKTGLSVGYNERDWMVV